MMRRDGELWYERFGMEMCTDEVEWSVEMGGKGYFGHSDRVKN